MRIETLPNTDLAVSALCYGCESLGSAQRGDAADALMDMFRQAGGNFFDTAHMYACWLPGGDGASERYLADYFRRRGGRDQCVIATKGGGPNFPSYRKADVYLSPRRLSADLDDSLGRLDCDRIDLYWLHRDDPRLAVGEIIDYLNEETRRGRIRYFAASNWTAARIAQANEYAAKKKLAGFAANQPQWSLARPPSRPNDAMQHIFEDADLPWHQKTGLAVIPYTPAARGYFAGGGAQSGFDSVENAERRRRAVDLADQKRCTPTQIALAYLMCHPFCVIPILGARRLNHLAEALQAAEVKLTAQEIHYLRMG
jgi:aryl-alcohol dehydrogenase-like predicted oxidoreductase